MANSIEVQITAGMTLGDVYDLKHEAAASGQQVAFIRRNCEYVFEFYGDRHAERQGGCVITAFGSKGDHLWDGSIGHDYATWSMPVIKAMLDARSNATGY